MTKACTGFRGQVCGTLTGGPGSPFRPIGPASSENLVGSRSDVWKPSVAPGVTGTSGVGPTSPILVPFGWNNFEGIVVICSASEEDPWVKAAVLWRFGSVKVGKSKLWTEPLASPCLVLSLADLNVAGFWVGGVMLILNDEITVWVGNIKGLSSSGWAAGETDTAPGFGAVTVRYADVLFSISKP